MRARLPCALGLAAVLAAAVAARAAPACDLEAAGAAAQACDLAALDRRLRLNDLQAIGSHNSYKRAIPPDELAAHRARDPRGADALDYAHPPLAEQLRRGLRTLELDVFHDPEGGRYLHPPGAHRRGYPAPPWPGADLARMRRPGFKVLHLADIDFRSRCVALQACLRELRDWSRAHPRHAPVLVLINAKDGPGGPGAVAPPPFDAAAFDALDVEIRAVFGRDHLIEPDDVQGAYPTLRDAVRAGRWPTLGEARGQVLFALDEEPRKVALYRGARRSLEGRAMFVNTDEASPAAAYLTLNDPVGQRARIARAVAAGFLVRTRADADTFEARAGDTRRRDAAFSGGAQFVSTDYPWPDPRRGAYRVEFPAGGYLRCNPARPACRAPGHETSAK